MKLRFVILALAAGAVGCSKPSAPLAPPDAIDRLMVQVSQEVVASYMFQPIELPSTASPQELVAALPKRDDVHWTGRKISTYKILKVRAAESGSMDSEHYTAVLLETNVGKKILLLRPMSTSGRWMGWYYKIYDTEPSA